MSVKRPSLAETMRQAAQAETVSPPSLVAVAPGVSVVASVPEAAPKIAPSQKPAGYYAATRAGKKKVTVALDPATHKRLKALSVERETTTEALLQEAIAHLLEQHS